MAQRKNSKALVWARMCGVRLIGTSLSLMVIVQYVLKVALVFSEKKKRETLPKINSY